MPQYRVRDPQSGRVITITGESPPTEQELTDIFAKVTGTTRPADLVADRSGLDRLVDSLPAAGGMAGGVVGGIGGTVMGMGVGGVPGAVGGAAVGGAGGEALRQLIERARGNEAPATSTGASADIGTAGMLQALYELGGQGFSRLLGAGGRALMGNAVRPAQAIRDQFPDVIDTILNNRLPVGRGPFGGAAGSAQAGALRMASSRNLRALLSQAEAAGTRFTPNDVSGPVIDLIDQITKQPLPEADMQALDNMIGEFLRAHPGPMTPNDVKDLKQAAQAIASPIFKAASRGLPVGAADSMRARFNGGIASGSKAALETIPGVGDAEATTQSLIGASRALRAAEGRRLPLSAEALSVAAPVIETLLTPNSPLPQAVRQGVTTYLISRGLMSPRSSSRIALALTNTQAQQLFQQFPRLAVEVVNQLQPASPSSGSTSTPSR
jgi:hypothetical protein